MARKRTDKLLTAATERAAIERLVEAYRAVPPATQDDWGDLSAFGDLGTRESMQRLDAEVIVDGFERSGGESQLDLPRYQPPVAASLLRARLTTRELTPTRNRGAPPRSARFTRHR